MTEIQKDLIVVLNDKNIPFEVLSAERTRWLEQSIKDFFGEEDSPRSPHLWENLRSDVSYSGDVVQSKIRKYLSEVNRPIFLLIDDWHGFSAITFERGSNFPEVIDSIYDFRWYVVDREFSFVLFRNDHDFIMYCARSNMTGDL